MATLTDPDKSRIDEGYDSGQGSYQPGDHEKVNLSDREREASNSSLDELRESMSKDVKSLEESPGIINKVVPPAAEAASKIPFLKKAAPAAVISAIVGGIITLLLTMSPLSFLVHIKEVAMQNWDASTPSMTARLNKIIDKKISNTTVNGACTGAIKVSMICKYSRLSNSTIKKLKSVGIEATKGGESVLTSGLWPNKTPDTFTFPDKDGSIRSLGASELMAEYKINPHFRDLFHAAYSPKYMGWSDSIIIKLLHLHNTSKQDKMATATDEKTAKAAIADAIDDGDDIAKKAAAKAAGTASDDIEKSSITRLFRDGVTKALKNVVNNLKDMKAGGITMKLAGSYCSIMKSSNLLLNVIRGYQITLLIRFAMTFLTPTDRIKAGETGGEKPISPEEVSAVASLLTVMLRDKSGNITSDAGINSPGMKNLLFGDTKFTGKGADSYKSFIPGWSAVNSPIGTFSSIGSSVESRTFCSIATNPATGVAITAAEAAAGGAPALIDAAITAAVSFTVGFTADALINSPVGQNIIRWAVDSSSWLIDGVKGFLYSFIGDLTANLSPFNTGNAYSSGFKLLLSQSANARGNVALTRSQSVMYQQFTKEVNLAYAEEDRSRLSPFDVSNPNTALGSIFGSVLPYYSNLGSVSGVFSSIGSMASNSLGSIFGGAKSNATAMPYTGCPDPAITSSDVAAGLFCDIHYGIPVEYLNSDPTAVLTTLQNDKQIDEFTGDPIQGSELDSWASICLDGSIDTAPSCTIADQKTAYYALYIIDHQIQKNLDGEDSDGAINSSTTATSSSTPGNYVDAGQSCAVGTTDLGTITTKYTGSLTSTPSPTIRLCQLSSIAGTGQDSNGNSISGGAVVNAAVSGVFQTIGEKAKSEGISLSAASSFRYQDSPGSGDTASSASPGKSFHQLGIAIDFRLLDGQFKDVQTCTSRVTSTDPSWVWLHQNAANYGVKQYSAENWHWDTSGMSNRCA